VKFIDLFAGLGGFHKALTQLGHKCVFASEIDSNLREVYKRNWGQDVNIHGDIRDIVKNQIEIIPEHDILCAGFPCQPFSKAGKQLGLEDARGTLFEEIIKILEFRKPQFLILENVRHIAKHNNEETWLKMKAKLEDQGYDVDHKDYSPHEFGIPQHRPRIFIVGALGKKALQHFSFEKVNVKKIDSFNLHDFIDKSPVSIRPLSSSHSESIQLWQEFIDSLPQEITIPGFPIWGMEFGANYPFETEYPARLSEKELGAYTGKFGISLSGMTKDEQMSNLPSYARVDKVFPKWKQDYIRRNRHFFEENKQHLQEVMSKIAERPSQSLQKLEWNVKDSRNINKHILQFRSSGLRVKKTDYFPCLVSTSNIPIISWEKRYITTNEGLKLQSLEGIQVPNNESVAFKAIGNAVNSDIVKNIGTILLN